MIFTNPIIDEYNNNKNKNLIRQWENNDWTICGAQHVLYFQYIMSVVNLVRLYRKKSVHTDLYYFNTMVSNNLESVKFIPNLSWTFTFTLLHHSLSQVFPLFSVLTLYPHYFHTFMILLLYKTTPNVTWHGYFLVMLNKCIAVPCPSCCRSVHVMCWVRMCRRNFGKLKGTILLKKKKGTEPVPFLGCPLIIKCLVPKN